MKIVTVAVVILVGVAAVVDVRTRRIPNLLTFGGAALGLAVQTFTAGLPGLESSAAGLAVGLGLFLPMFLLGGMGAGDVKLLAAVGAWLGPMGAVWSALFSVMAGGVLAIFVALRHRYLAKAFRNLWGLFGVWRVIGVQPVPGMTLDDAAGPKLAYGIAIAAGTVAAVVFK